jgi:acetylornithine deacetylase/succinyl-diaminopimelate desuccinylase-like protein
MYAAGIAELLDIPYLVSTASSLAKVPTNVPLGWDTLAPPDVDYAVHYVQNVVRPELVRLGYFDLLDVPRNNMVVTLGDGSAPRSLMVQNYTIVQHHNQMVDPFSGRVASAIDHGVDRLAVFGQGMSQSKAHQAVMLTVLKAIRESGITLRGRLLWAVNNEGMSSHDCSNAILDAIGIVPDFCVLQYGTGLRLSLGNRGRVDVNVHVKGKATHSSSPQDGLSAIAGANEVLNRVAALPLPESHPILGARQAIAYKVKYEPLSPHTLPSDAYLTFDCRMLPGDSASTVTDTIRQQLQGLGDWQVDVEQGPSMLPVLVDPEESSVGALQDAICHVRGERALPMYGPGAFDAGGPAARGISTVMYGASGGDFPLGVDFVTLDDLETEARVLTEFIIRYLA